MKISHTLKTFLSFSVLVVLTDFLFPFDAAAHLVTTGMGPVYDGIGHLLLTPEDLVPVIAVALLAGLRGKNSGRQALFFLPVAWLAGGFAGLMTNGEPIIVMPAFSFLILGGLIAADLRLPDNITTAVVTAVGLTHGFYNGTAMAGGPRVSGLLGIAAILFTLIAIVSAFVVSLQAAWPRVAVRVTGSWIAAIGLLMLGWLAKGSG